MGALLQSSRPYIAFLSLMMGALLMGAEGGGCCDECQEALDHMGSKIGDQHCASSTMERARNKIVEACDEDFDVDMAIRNLEEQCYTNQLASTSFTPQVMCGCEHCSSRFSVLFANQASFLGPVQFQIDDGFELHTTEMIRPGAEERVLFDSSHGDTIAITVRDEGEDTFGYVGGIWIPTIYRTLCLAPIGNHDSRVVIFNTVDGEDSFVIEHMPQGGCEG